MSNNTQSEDSYIIHDIIPALESFGYPRAGQTDKIKIKDIKIRIGSTYKYPDVVYYENGDPILLIEAKKTSDKEALDQAFSYVKLFPYDEYSKTKIRPKYFAITEGKHITGFYKYAPKFDERGELQDEKELLSTIPSYQELLALLGLSATKTILTPEIFADEVFSYILSAYAKDGQKTIDPELIKIVVRQIYEYLLDPREYTTKYPFTEIEGRPDRKYELRRALETYSWEGVDATAIALTFQSLIKKAFQGTSLNQYITPSEVVEFMINLVHPKATDTLLDFECGSGSFLRSALYAGVDPQNICGIDIADLPYYVTKVYLALYTRTRGKNIDTLPIAQSNGLLYEGEPRDIVISNPAGGGQYDKDGELGDVSKVMAKLNTDLDGDGRVDANVFTEYYFSVQQAIKNCKSGGQICLVVPEGLLANSTDDKLRQFITSHSSIRAVISLPRKIFYKGTTTRNVQSPGSRSSQKFSILYCVRNLVKFSDVSTKSDENYPIFLASIDDESNLENKLASVYQQYKTWSLSGSLASQIIVEKPIPKIQKKPLQSALIEPEMPLFDHPVEKPKPTITTTITDALKSLFD